MNESPERITEVMPDGGAGPGSPAREQAFLPHWTREHHLPAAPSRTIDLALAILGNMVALGLVFAPWFQYETLRRTTETAPGLKTDGLLLVVTAIVAIIALALVRRGDPGDDSFGALIGFGASVAGLVTVGVTLMFTDAQRFEALGGPSTIGPVWGIYAALLAMVVATIFAFRTWRAASAW